MNKENRLWIGAQSDPDERRQIVVSDADEYKIPLRGTRGQATVEDQLTGEFLTVRRASCGLPNCLCALELIR